MAEPRKTHVSELLLLLRLEGKYGPINGPIKYSLWRAILKVKDFFKYCSSFNIGRGDTVQFWHHSWLGESALKTQFPALFLRSRNKDGFIVDFVTEGNWNLQMRTRLSDIEIEEAGKLLHMLQNTHLKDADDELIWWTEGKPFTVRHCNKIITTARIEVQELRVLGFRKDKVWRNETPARVNFFMWLLFRRRILTDDRFKEMGSYLASICSFCKEDEETRDHLFLNCRVTKEVFSLLTWGTGSSYAHLHTIEDHMNNWDCDRLTQIGQRYWKMLPHAFFWSVWLARNSCRFEEEKVQSWRLLQFVKKLLWSWGLGDKLLEKIRIEQLMFSWKQLIYQ